MADDLSLLLKIRGDAAGAKQATTDTRAAIAALRSQLGSDFGVMQKAGESALAGLGNHLNVFVGERLPIVGGSFVRITENLRGLGEESKKGQAEFSKFQKTIDDLSTSTGKSKSELINFLTGFVQLESQAKRDSAAVETFGATAAQKLIPELEKAGTELSQVATSAEGMASGLASAAGPIGIAVLAVAALTAGAALLAKEFFDLTVSTAESKGKLFDLSQQTGVSVETLSALQIVARTTGSDIEQIAASLGIFQKNLEATHDPTSKQAALFENLGITTNNTEAALRQSLTVLQKLPEGYRQTALALELYGRGGKSMLAILKETNGDLDGAIKRFREMGILISTEDAEAADKFNDQLALLGFQVRATAGAITKDAIPPLLDGLKSVSKAFAENKESIELTGKAIGLFIEGNLRVAMPALVIAKTTLESVRDAWLGVKAAALIASGVSVESAADIISAAKTALAEVPKPLAGPSETGTGQETRAFRIQQEQLAGLKTLAEEQVRISQDAIQKADIAYKQGQISIAQDTAINIAELKKQKDARIDALNAEIQVKQKEQTLRKDDLSEQKKLYDDIEKLRQDSRNAESEYNRAVADLENKAQDERNKHFIEYAENRLALRQKANEADIKLIETQVKNGEILAQDGEDQIEAIEKKGLDDRHLIIRQELSLKGLGFEQQKRILQQLAELKQEETETERQQAERRKQIKRDEIEFERSLLLQRQDDQLSLGDTYDRRRIASLRALGDLRVKSEEGTQKEILAVRLAAIDRESSVAQSRLDASKAITDPKQRKAEEQKLNDELKRLLSERAAIQEQGDRDIEAGRQKDLQLKRKYIEELEALDGRIAENDLAQRRSDLEKVAQRYGLNAQIIAAFRMLTLDEEAERHKRILNEIDAQEAEAHAVDVGNKHRLEIEERYNKLREQENKRFHGAQDNINKPGGAGVSGKSALSAIDQLRDGLTEKLSGTTLKATQAGIEALTGAFQGLGDAVGQVVQAWVLYGNAGTSVRKMTAEILAGVAQQAAIKAVFELAEGFAALAMAFFGIPNAGPSAHAHFVAAGIYGSIAGIAAVAGRGVAGNSFAQGGSATGSSLGTGSNTGGSTATSQSPATIKEEWVQRRPIIIQLHGDASQFNWKVIDALHDDVSKNGRARAIIIDTAKKG